MKVTETATGQARRPDQRILQLGRSLASDGSAQHHRDHGVLGMQNARQHPLQIGALIADHVGQAAQQVDQRRPLLAGPQSQMIGDALKWLQNLRSAQPGDGPARRG